MRWWGGLRESPPSRIGTALHWGKVGQWAMQGMLRHRHPGTGGEDKVNNQLFSWMWSSSDYLSNLLLNTGFHKWVPPRLECQQVKWVWREKWGLISLSLSNFFCVGQFEPLIFIFIFSLAETTKTNKKWFGSDQIYIPSLLLPSWDETNKQIMPFSTIVSFALKQAISFCALFEKQRQGTVRVS